VIPAASTLAGVQLNSDVAQVLSQHPDARKGANDARWWQWRVPGMGTVTITSDDAGKVNRVNFVAEGPDGSVDLPCAGRVPFKSSDDDLNRMLRPTPCSAFNGAAYGFPGGSVVAITFGHAMTSQLTNATWFRDTGAYPSPVGQVQEIVRYLRPVLNSVGGAARIYYAADCSPLNDTGLALPMVALQPADGFTGVAGVRRVLRDNPNVTVTRDRSGMVRIAIGNVARQLLDSDMPRLELGRDARWRGDFAVDAIRQLASDYAGQQRLPFGIAPSPFRIIDVIGEPVPQLPAALQNVTFDGALDVVARTFKGVVAYGACVEPSGRNLFAMSFADGAQR
jgi:hypothetical protein